MKNYNRLVRHAGNADLFHAIELSIAAMAAETSLHLHTEGLRGTGKTTLIRSARELFPPMLRIRGCAFNCRPDAPHCPAHKGLTARQVEKLGSETVPRPFLEISHAAKTGTVVGTIDLGRLMDRTSPSAALLPGTIPQAHRGVIFVDEINRLADTSPELADILLDVMGTKPGRIQIEESGLPVLALPVSVTVWAASNPDEDPGSLQQIRRQLADRFDLAVKTSRPADPEAVLSILRSDEACPTLRAGARGDLGLAGLPAAHLREVMAAIYVDFGIESLRAVESLELAARAAAGCSGRTDVRVEDLLAVAPGVFGHRTDAASIVNILRYLEARAGGGAPLRPENARAACVVAESGSGPASEKAGQKSVLKAAWEKLRAMTRSPGNAGTPGNSAVAAAGKPSMPPSRQPAASGSVSLPESPPDKAVPLRELPLSRYVQGDDTKLL